MKRLFLIIAICLIIALSALWGYLLIFGAPDSAQEFFANFNFGNEELLLPEVLPPIFELDETTLPTPDPLALRQITQKPVAGYAEIESDETDNSPFVYYIEAGIGHIFKVDITSGNEERLSNITIPNTKHGAIAKNGSFAIVQSGDPGTGELTIVRLTGGVDTATSESIVTDAHSFSISDDNQILFSQTAAGTHKGFSYNPETGVTSDLFTLPFNQATILWGSTADATHYTFPRPAAQLEGYLYSITNGAVRREPLGGFGFSAQQSPSLIIASFSRNGEYVSVFFDKSTNTQTESSTDFIPEKCLLSSDTLSALCALPNIGFTPNSLISWYKGDVGTSDQLALINLTDGQTSSLNILDLQTVSGTAIDVISLANTTSSNIYFNNKTDRSLWVYEIR